MKRNFVVGFVPLRLNNYLIDNEHYADLKGGNVMGYLMNVACRGYLSRYVLLGGHGRKRKDLMGYTRMVS